MATKSKRRNPILTFLLFFLALSIIYVSAGAAYMILRTDNFSFSSDYKLTEAYQRGVMADLFSQAQTLANSDADSEKSWGEIEDAKLRLGNEAENLSYYIVDRYGNVYKKNTDAKSPSEFSDQVRAGLQESRNAYTPFGISASYRGYDHLLTLDGEEQFSEIMNTRIGQREASQPFYRSAYGQAIRQNGQNYEYVDNGGGNSQNRYIGLAVAAEGRMGNFGQIYQSYYQWYISTSIMLIPIIACIVALLLLLVTAIKHKSFSCATAAIAGRTARIWLEVKLVCLLVCFSLVIVAYGEAIRNSDLFSLLLGLLPLWLVWLVWNDFLHHKRAFFMNNIPASAARFLRSLESRYSFLARMKRRIVLLVAAEFFLGSFALILILALEDSSIPFVFLLAIAAVALIFLFIRAYNRDMDDFAAIIDYTKQIRAGVASAPLHLRPQSDFLEMADDLNDIHSGMERMVEEQVKSNRMKVELITNVSHDLKTPLTSIINYVDLLGQERLEPAFANDYVSILARKAQRLKNLVQDLFEVSKATSGAAELFLEQLDLVSLIEQTAAELDEKNIHTGTEVRLSFEKPQLLVRADGKKLHRVLENLLGNALKYSLEGTRIYVSAGADESNARVIFKNVSSYEMHFSPDEILERFTRGDASRTTDGSGLGLAIAKSFLELCGGSLQIQLDGDLFKAIVTLPLYRPYAERMLQGEEAGAEISDSEKSQELPAEDTQTPSPQLMWDEPIIGQDAAEPAHGDETAGLQTLPEENPKGAEISENAEAAAPAETEDQSGVSFAPQQIEEEESAAVDQPGTPAEPKQRLEGENGGK